MREYKKVVKRNIEAVKEQIRRRRFIIAIDETHEPFYGRLKKGAGLHEHQGRLNRDKTIYNISRYIAVLPDYKGFDWVFATNIKYEKIFRYVRYYKKRWGIETTFRVQDEHRQNAGI